MRTVRLVCTGGLGLLVGVLGLYCWFTFQVEEDPPPLETTAPRVIPSPAIQPPQPVTPQVNPIPAGPQGVIAPAPSPGPAIPQIKKTMSVTVVSALPAIAIDPNTPLEDLLPPAPKVRTKPRGGLVEDLAAVPETVFQEFPAAKPGGGTPRSAM